MCAVDCILGPGRGRVAGGGEGQGPGLGSTLCSSHLAGRTLSKDQLSRARWPKLEKWMLPRLPDAVDTGWGRQRRGPLPCDFAELPLGGGLGRRKSISK